MRLGQWNFGVLDLFLLVVVLAILVALFLLN
jgi:hypothetical protein